MAQCISPHCHLFTQQKLCSRQNLYKTFDKGQYLCIMTKYTYESCPNTSLHLKFLVRILNSPRIMFRKAFIQKANNSAKRQRSDTSIALCTTLYCHLSTHDKTITWRFIDMLRTISFIKKQLKPITSKTENGLVRKVR